MSLTNSYVHALRELSVEAIDGSLDEDIIDFQLILEKNSEVGEFISNYLYDFEEKLIFINSLKDQGFTEYFLNFLKVIISEKNQNHLKEILKKYQTQKLKDQGVILGIVYTTLELTDSEISNLENKFSKKLNKTIKFKNQIDQNLISGIKVVIDDLVFDYSIDQKLKLLKKELLN